MHLLNIYPINNSKNVMKGKANYMQETKVRIQTSHVIQTLKEFIKAKITEGNESSQSYFVLEQSHA